MKLLFIFAVSIFVVTGEIYQQPLIRVESRKTKMFKEGTWDSYYKEKQLLEQSFTDKYQNLNDFDELEYVADVFIGTPRQAFKFHYDVTSSEFWVTDKSCETYDNPAPRCPSFCYQPGGTSFCNPKCKQGKKAALENSENFCASKSKFDSTNSSTFYHPNEPVDSYRDYEFAYIQGSYIGEDTVILAAETPIFGFLNVRLSSFLQAKELSPAFADTPFDGILGFGPASAFLLNNKNKFDKLMYTVYLQDIDNKYDVTGGYITFGGLDEEHCSSEIEYQSTLSKYDFIIYNVSFGIPETPAGNIPVSWQATVDTSRTSIVGPAEIIKTLKKVAGAKEDGTIDCGAEIQNLSIKMGIENDSKILTIPGKHLMIKNADESCSIALDSMPPSKAYENKWIFGTPWFRSYCNIFTFESDYKIAFASVIA